jgi:hypothetical protein
MLLLIEIVESHNCKFDALKPKNIIEANVQYLTKENHDLSAKRSKRQTVSFESLYQPIRFHVYFTNFTYVGQLQQNRLRRVINHTVNIASQLFSGTDIYVN